MKDLKFSLINEDCSPLFRIMSVYNSNTVNKHFTNNVCAFHVGNGVILSVAHNLRGLERLPPVISNTFYQNEIANKIKLNDRQRFSNIYPIIPGTNFRELVGINPGNAESYAKKLDEAKADRRYVKLYNENCCKPFLVATFRKDAFCGDSSLNVHIPNVHHFIEPSLNRFTFLLELELLDSFINEDISIYRIINTKKEIIDKLPFINVDFQMHDTDTDDCYCLQSAPFDNLGRILNKANIEGILDNFSQEADILDNKYTLDGIRYLIKGYFRFGSSGAPYVKFDQTDDSFKVFALQSQASYIQLSINGKMDGNVQFVNGVATPLFHVEQRLKEILDN